MIEYGKIFSFFSSGLVSKSRKPALTIAVPTYNQPKRFKGLLDSLTTQELNGVEILVRDDSTNKESELIDKSYISKLPIRYIHGEKIGLDAADLFLLEKSKGEYVWWIGDDILASGATKKILYLIGEYHDISYIWVNSRLREGGIPAVNLGESRFFRDGNEALEKLADMLGFLSACIFKREEVLPCIPLARKYIGSHFAGLYAPLYILSHGKGRFYYLHDPYILTSPRDPAVPTWYDGFTVFAITFFKIVDEFRGKFKTRSIRKAQSDNFSGIWKGIIVYREKGYTHDIVSKNIKILDIAKLYWTFHEFWIALPFLLLPRPIARILYNIYIHKEVMEWLLKLFGPFPFRIFVVFDALFTKLLRYPYLSIAIVAVRQ